MKKDSFVKKVYFSPTRSIIVVMKSAFFTENYFLRTIVSQNAFNFNQIEF